MPGGHFQGGSQSPTMYTSDGERNSAEDSDKPEWLKELMMKKGAAGRASSSLVMLVDRNRAASSGEPLKQSTQESKCEGTKAVSQVIHPSKAETSNVNTPGGLYTRPDEFAASRALTFHRVGIQARGGGSVPGTEESVQTKVEMISGVPVSASSSGLFPLKRGPQLDFLQCSSSVGHGHTSTSDSRASLTTKKPADKMGEDYTPNLNEQSEVNGYGSTSERSKMNSPTSSSTFSDLSHYQPSSSDESERELEYGPGIVDKLKSKFISISLKEKRFKIEGVLRRYSSMENLLDKDTTMFQATGLSAPDRLFVAGNRANGNSSLNYSNLKKVKSMETLLLESDQSRKRSLFPITPQPALRVTNQVTVKFPGSSHSPRSMLVNEDVVIIENKANTQGHNASSMEKVFKRRDLNRQTSTPSITDDELPKPDTVRNYKRLFEPLDKKSKTQSNVRRKPPVVRAITTSTGSKCVNTITSCSPQETAIVQPISKQQDNEEKDLSQNDGVESSCKSKYKYAKHSAKEPLTNGNQSQTHFETEVTKERTYLVLNDGHEENDVVSSTKDTLDRISSANLNMTFGGVKSAREGGVEKGSEPAAITNSSCAFISDVSSKVTPPVQRKLDEKPVANIKPIPKSSQSASVHSSKENWSTSHAIITKGDEVKMVPVEVKGDELEGISTSKNVDVNRSDSPLAANKITPLTDSEAGDILKPTALIGNKKPTWQKPPPSTSSVVFDFRGKSVKANVALTPAPFGCKPIKVARRVRVDGKESKNGLVNGMMVETDGNDLDDEDLEFEDPGLGADLPHPSGIFFEGENVIIGKGSLLTTRNKNLSTQFDDSATSTYEYPSGTCGSNNSPSDELPKEMVLAQENKELKSSLAHPVAGSLSSYTPTVLSSNSDTFELGVSRPIHRETLPPAPQQESTNSENDEEMLKPADPEDISSWSSSTTSDLLF
ncbi:uncharacterized protein LOC106464015 [Limulus polyphemus]|uniref:Uncharacterized protein LOC106464015 n=1 Tax=Limulus polyphemus TaxID=6850 RepID=A0ABM1BD50_LIMPO|nr:uncharacterized protein LOC106464015 [Limulus polyphemus]XP_013779574.1 uncharacterized protein LOC106464015 [Limulus polyphemus]